MKQTLPETVQKAQSGDPAALAEIVRDVQGRVYGVALRMLWHPEDAQDVTQEILLRVVTHLGGFRGDSKFETWVYRIAVNHLLTWRKSRMEEQGLTFEAFGRDLEEGLADHGEHLDNVILSQEI